MTRRGLLASLFALGTQCLWAKKPVGPVKRYWKFVFPAEIPNRNLIACGVIQVNATTLKDALAQLGIWVWEDTEPGPMIVQLGGQGGVGGSAGGNGGSGCPVIH